MIMRFDNEYGNIKSVSGVFDVVFTGKLDIDTRRYNQGSPALEPLGRHGYNINTSLKIIGGEHIYMAAAFRINTEDNFCPVSMLSIDKYPYYYPSDCVPNPATYYTDIGKEIIGIRESISIGNCLDVIRRLKRRTRTHNLEDVALTRRLFEDIVSGRFNCFRVDSGWPDDKELYPVSFDEIYYIQDARRVIGV